MGEAVGVLIGALSIAGVYALSGVGFVVLFRSTSVLSFAQGEFMAAGAVVFYSGTHAWHVGSVFAAVASIVLVGAAGWVVYRVAFRRLAGASPFIVAIATVALGTVLQMVEYLIWGAAPLQLNLSFGNHVVSRIAGQGIQGSDVVAVAAAIVLIGALMLWLTHSGTGLKMRALGEDPSLAAYYHVNVDRLSGIAWALGAVFAATAGIAYALMTNVNVGGIPNLGLLVFPAILLGGMDSIGGAVVGALLIGLLEGVISVTVGGNWQDPVAYALMLIVLLLKPNGLFGTRQVVRL